MKKLFALFLAVFCFMLIASAEDGNTCTLLVRGLSMQEDGTIEIIQIDSCFSVIKDGAVIGNIRAGESFDASADMLRPVSMPSGWCGEDVLVDESQPFMTVTIWENIGVLLLEESLPGGCYQVENIAGDCWTAGAGRTLLPAGEYILRQLEAPEGARWTEQSFSFTILPLQTTSIYFEQNLIPELKFDDVSAQESILAKPSNDGIVTLNLNSLFSDKSISEARVFIHTGNCEIVSSSVGTLETEQNTTILCLENDSIFEPIALSAKCDPYTSDLDISIRREAVRTLAGRTEGSVSTIINEEVNPSKLYIPVDDGLARITFDKTEEGIVARNIGSGSANISNIAVLVPAGTGSSYTGNILFGEKTDYILWGNCSIPSGGSVLLPIDFTGSYAVMFLGSGISPKQITSEDRILGTVLNTDPGLFYASYSGIKETEWISREPKIGTLRTESGEGRKNIVLLVSDSNGNGCIGFTNEKGEFSFFGMRDDTRYSLTAILPSDAFPVYIPEFVSSEDDMNFLFSQSSAIEGRTMPGATVQTDNLTVVADSDGWFRLSGLNTGKALISVTSPDDQYGFSDADWSSASTVCYSVLVPENGSLFIQIPYTRLIDISCLAENASLTISHNGRNVTLFNGDSISVLPGEYQFKWIADDGYLLNVNAEFTTEIEESVTFSAETYAPSSVIISGIKDKTVLVDGMPLSDNLRYGSHVAAISLNEDEYLVDSESIWRQNENTVVASFTLTQGENLTLDAPHIATFGHIQGTCPDDVVVTAIDVSGNVFRTVAIDNHYVISGLKAGTYLIAAQYDGEKSPVLIGSNRVDVSGAVHDGPSVELRSSASLMIETFRDENVNGGRGKYEERVRHVHVAVLDANGFTLTEGESDAEGNLLLEDIIPGNVTVRVTLPDGYIFTSPSAVNSGRGFAVIPQVCDKETDYPMYLAEGETSYLTIGVVKSGTISGFAFLDNDGNGICESGDSKLQGIIVSAKGSYSVSETVTGPDGTYCLDHLLPDAYTVTFSAPETYVFTRYSREGERNRSLLTDESNIGSVSIKVGEGTVKDEQNVGYVPAASISGIAFLDANYNGVYDVGELFYPDVLVELRRTTTQEVVAKTVTDGNGFYTFPYLRTGRYDIRVLLPDDGSEYTFVTGEAYNQNSFFSVRRECIRSIALDVGQKMNASIGCLYRSTLSGNVFSDDNYNGLPDADESMLSDIRVTLTGPNINESKLTRNGFISFDELLPGDYTLTVDAPSGYTYSLCVDNNAPMFETKDGVSALIQVPMGCDVCQYVALIEPTVVSGLVYADEDLNNAFDGRDSGTSGVKVTLQGENGSFEIFTDDSGIYCFDKVMPGTYSVMIELPYNSHCERISQTISVSAGQSVSGPFFPLLRYGTLDVNWNYHGCPLENVELELTSESNVYSFRSDSTGHMGSDSILPGDYILRIHYPIDIAPVSGLAMTETLSFLQGKQIILNQDTVDASYCFGSVFKDGNDNGLRDEGECDAADVVIRLYDENINLLEQTVTDYAGKYSFNNLVPGSYWLEIELDDNSVCNLSMVPLTVQTEGMHFNVSPFALVKLCTLRGSAELLIGEQRLPYSGLSITLNGTGAATTTLQDGSYSFTRLRPGEYSISADSGEYVFLLADDKNYPAENPIMISQSSSRPIQLSNGETFEGSVVLLQPAIVGDIVFLDNNQNGLYDSTDDMVPGINVYLLKDGEVVYTVRTDAYGYFLFDDVYPGKYHIAVEPPDGLTFTSHREDFTMLTSCLSKEKNGLIISDDIIFKSGEVNYNCDLGLRLIDGARKPDNIKPGPAQDWSGK